MSEAPAPTQHFLRRHAVKILLSIVFGSGLAWMLARGGLPIVPPSTAFSKLRPWTIGGYLGMLFFVHLFRATRWRYMLRPLGRAPIKAVLAASWIGFAAILMSPLRSGEIVRPYLLAKRTKIPVWQVTGTVGAERIIDGVVLTVALLVGLFVATPLSPLPDHVGDLHVPVAAVPKAAFTALAIFFCAFATMAVFYFWHDVARKITRAIVGVVSEKLADRLDEIVYGVASGLRFLRERDVFLPFFVETLLYWFFNIAGVWLLAWGAGLEGVSFAEATVIVGCIGIGILVPAGPGFFGAFQLSTYMALAMYIPERELLGPGVAFVFLVYAEQVGAHLLAAAAGLALGDDAPALEAEAKA